MIVRRRPGLTERFAARVCLVTGAAGGIGSAITARLLAEGALVLAVDRNAAGLERLGTELAEFSGAEAGSARLVGWEADLGDTAAATGAVEEAVRRFGRIDVLCNNHADTDPAVILSDRDLVTTPLETWQQTLAVNLMGPVAACRAAVPHMQRQGGGCIVNTVSTSGMSGDLLYTAYGASKAALIALTRYTATQYGRDGIRANAVAPGMVMTPDATNKVSPEEVERICASNLVAGSGRPEDIAAAVAFLASDDARYLTGEVIRVDGGQLSHLPTYAAFSDR